MPPRRSTLRADGLRNRALADRRTVFPQPPLGEHGRQEPLSGAVGLDRPDRPDVAASLAVRGLAVRAQLGGRVPVAAVVVLAELGVVGVGLCDERRHPVERRAGGPCAG